VEEMIGINSENYWYSSATYYCGMKGLKIVTSELKHLKNFKK